MENRNEATTFCCRAHCSHLLVEFDHSANRDQPATAEKRLNLFRFAVFLSALVVLDLSGCRRSEDPGAGSKVAKPSGSEPTGESAAAENGESEVQAVPPSQLSGTVEGTVRFVGERLPSPTIVPVGGDAQYCGHEYSKEDWVVDPASRGIRYAIVHLSGQWDSGGCRV